MKQQEMTEHVMEVLRSIACYVLCYCSYGRCAPVGSFKFLSIFVYIIQNKLIRETDLSKFLPFL